MAANIGASTGIIPGALNGPRQAAQMGALAAHALKKPGYTNVCFMDGGTQGWLNSRYATNR